MQSLSPQDIDLIAANPQLTKQLAALKGFQTDLADVKRKYGTQAFLEADWLVHPHPKQQEFYFSDKPIHMFSGAMGSGKTWILVNKFAALALGRHPTIYIEPPVNMWLVGLSHGKVEQVLLPYFKAALPVGAIIGYDKQSGVMRIRHDTGAVSTVGFMSGEMDVEKFQSNRLDAIGFDEAPPKIKGVKIFKECISRFKPNRTLYIRLAGTPWELPRFFRHMFYEGAEREPDKIGFTMCGLADNPYVPKEQVEYQMSRYSGKELEARLYGKFVRLTGVVFDTFDYRHHVVDDFEMPASWPRYAGIDPTEGRRAWAITWTAIAPDGVHYVYRELRVAGTYEDIVSAIRFQEGGDRIQLRGIDPFASKFNMKTGQSWTRDLAKLGLATTVIDRSKRTQWRSRAGELLGDPSIGKPAYLKFFRRGAAETITAFASHEWKEENALTEVDIETEKEADDPYKDLVDSVLYTLALRPRFFNVETYIARKRARKAAGTSALDDTFGY